MSHRFCTEKQTKSLNYKNYILFNGSSHFKISGVANPSEPRRFHSIQAMKAIFSHVSLDWREMGERIATLSQMGKRIGAKKHPKGSPAPFQLRINARRE